MTGFTLAAAASIVAGLSIGAAATVGVTLAVRDHGAPRRPWRTDVSPGPTWWNTATAATTGIACPATARRIA